MSNQAEPITKLTRDITRSNGSQVRIVAQLTHGPDLKPHTHVFVLRRDTAHDNWSLCEDRPAPGYKTMSREDYLNHGRSEMLQAVSHAEILSLTKQLGQPLSSLH